MLKETLLKELRDLERRENPGIAKGYTLKQVWTVLRTGGLDLTFSGFKSAFYREQERREKAQNFPNALEKCPHCGGALINREDGGNEKTDTDTATNSQPAVAPEGVFSSERASRETMGDMLARRLQDGSPNRIARRRDE